MEREISVKGTESWSLLVDYVNDNYYAWFHGPSYHRYRERHFSILLNVKRKSRSRVPVHGTCLQSRSRTITMRRFMILAIIGTEKDTSILLEVKFGQSQWSIKSRSRVPVHGACLKSMSRKIPM